MNIDYNKISQEINGYAHECLVNIKKNFYQYFNENQKSKIDKLLKTNFIVIDEPNNEDIKFFSNQNNKLFDISNVPSAHGGRTKNDELIHIYVWSNSFKNCQDTEQIINKIKQDIVVHEIFHYFIMPKMHAKNLDDEEFLSDMTEGLVQLYSENYAKNNNLKIPMSNYNSQVKMATELINGFDYKSEAQVHKNIFNDNLEMLLEKSRNGFKIKENYQIKSNLLKQVEPIIVEFCQELDFKHTHIDSAIRSLKNIGTPNEIMDTLKKEIFNRSDSIYQKKKYLNRLNQIKYYEGNKYKLNENSYIVNSNNKIHLLKLKQNLLKQKQVVDKSKSYQQQTSGPTLKIEKSGFVNALLVGLILGIIFVVSIIIGNILL